MGKKEYLRRLGSLLRNLPAEERSRLLEYYAEILDDKIESGVSEYEATEQLGSVYALANKILGENPNRRRVPAWKVTAIVASTVLAVSLVCWAGYSALSARGSGAQPKTGSWNFTPWAASGTDAAVEQKTYTASAGSLKTVTLSAENKEVDLIPVNSEQITVNYPKHAYDQYEFSSRNGVFSMINHTEVFGGSWGFHTDDDKIKVQIPAQYMGDITVSTSNGDISASGFAKLGTFDCETENSGISISDLSAQQVKLHTQNAAIALKGVTAQQSLTADTQNAVIALDGIAGPDLSLRTDNAMVKGVIRGAEEDYSVDARTDNAVCNLTNRSGGSKKLSVYTTNGLINIRFEK
jgi:hypothetical protein